jgi:hypothetical protein
MYPELRIGANKLWFWNLRTQDPFYGYNGDGGITHIDLRDDPNYLEVTPSDEDDSAHSPYFGFRPACNLPSEVGVLDNPDTDGVYILQWWTPPQIFVDINDSIYQYVNGWVMMDDTHSDLREIDSIVAKEGDTLWQS